jgi:hypothetical protein
MNGLRPESVADGAPVMRATTPRASITETRAWLSHRGRGLLAIAAVLLLTTAAVIARLTAGPRTHDQTVSASLPPATSVATAVAPPPTVSTSTHTSKTTAVPGPQAKAANHKPIPATDAAVTPIVESPTDLIPGSARPKAQAVTTVSVVHLHRVGSCQGHLVVSRDAISFVPDDKANEDAFVFKYGEFLYTLTDGQLTIKSASRTYRFRGTAADGNAGGESQLTALVGHFPRIR